MIPQPTDPRWKQLISGEKKVKLNSIPLSMMFSRLARVYAGDPSSISDLSQQAHDFCHKYKAILQDDFKVMF